MQKTNLINLIVLLLFLGIVSSCKSKLTKAEGEKQLKAFDNEIILLAQRASETHAYQSLQQLIKIKNLPLPFQYNITETEPGKPYAFDFDTMKGVYSFNHEKNELYKSAASDSIILIFPYHSEKDSVAKLIISEYREQLSAWNILLPVKFDAKLLIANHTILDARCQGKIAHGFPVDYVVDVDFSNFKIQVDLKTKLSRKRGKVAIETTIKKENKTLLLNSTKLITSINKKQQIEFSEIKSTIDVFPITVDIDIDRRKMDRNSVNFISDFNQHSSILIYGNNQTKTLGRIELKERTNNSRLNPAVIYNNGTEEYLDDLLFTVSQLLNIKL